MSEFPPSYYKATTERWTKIEDTLAELLHQIFHSGNLPGKRLLDFGCGPFIYRMASASLRYNDIVLADYSETNRKEIQKWLNEDPNTFDLTPFLARTAILEGFEEIKEGVKRIERRIRQSVKTVIGCDGLSDQILPKGIGKFDVITCFYCITNFAFSDEEHKKFLRKLSAYLNDDGVVIVITVFGVDKYQLHQWIDHYPCKKESIRQIIKDGGFRVQKWYSHENTTLPEHQCLYTLIKLRS
ncbi:indolethylamine N-methyltransferase-like [Centruroides sculpturatus]|uniref:indolethylamine N-methyltransferase-like n=1 Tax=Centruroides sculpturatus TaxID=218467 RepID=UPI000C6D04E0|nr:indolethylamine N-methyltransferase-like [Centruroides sculpturatus]